MREEAYVVQQRVQRSFFKQPVIGNYEIVRKIGEGSFGSVYLAVHVLTRHEVVLKSAAKAQSNLAAEIANMSRLAHPHIVRLYEYIVMPEQVWMVLEYCNGDDLLRLLASRALDLRTTKRIFAQLVGALAYAHSFNCAHRDLKLENVFLDAFGNVKLGDFGFTRAYVPRTLLETVCGTESYMAPELILRKKYAPEAADVWSLGVILYALLYRKLPFDEDSSAQTVRMIVETDPPFDAVEGDDQLVSLLKRMLHKTPHSRPRAAEALDYLGEQGRLQKHNLSQQLAIAERASMFATRDERTILKGLKALSVDLHAMAGSVAHHKCDPLHGLWYTALDSRKLQRRIHQPLDGHEQESPALKRLSESPKARKERKELSEVKIEDSDPFKEKDKADEKRKGTFDRLFTALRIKPKPSLMAYYEEEEEECKEPVKKVEGQMSRPMSTYSQVSQLSQLSQSSAEVTMDSPVTDRQQKRFASSMPVTPISRWRGLRIENIEEGDE